MDRLLDARNLAERLRWEQQEYWMHLEAASALEKYPAKQHARRVQEKLGVEDGLIYLPGESRRNNEDSDMPAPFRQRRYFYYLSGCNEPDCHVTYDIENDTLALFIPRIDPSRVIWNGRGSTPAEALEKYDIDQVFYIDQLEHFLQDWAKFCRGNLYILHQAQNPLIPGLDEPVDSESLQPAVDLARVVKDDHEIRLIKKANDISSQAHKEILANILRFKNEAQVEGLFLDVCVSKQAKQQAYDPIAASGPNAGTLHYDDNDQDFEDRQLMCLDAGCEWELYASDITRTFPLSGNWPSEEARNVYQLVQRMQETCIQGLAPGVRYLDLHIKAHQIAIDGLLSLGILHNGTREEIYKAGTSKAFFPHGLGHHVGLEVHDVGQGTLMSMTKGNPKYEMAPSIFPKDFHLPVYDPEMCRSPVDIQSGHLEEGMVVTVEPGIYFSTYALSMFYLPSPIHSKYINTKVVSRYLPVGGVRIEDDILITSKGYENLTTAPKGEAMLEIIRSQNAQWPFVSDSADLGPTVRENAPVKEEKTLLRAPGFPRHTPEPVPEPKPLARASTMPVKRMRDHRFVDSVDFEPFEGPSLFANFKRSRTTDDNVRRWKASRERSAPITLPEPKPRTTMCGENSSAFTHAYLDFPNSESHSFSTPLQLHITEKKSACKKCTILVEAVDRLRENLNKSEQGSPKPEQISPKPTPRVEPVATRKTPEMENLSRVWKTKPVLTSSGVYKQTMLMLPGKREVGLGFTEEPLPMMLKKSGSTLYSGFGADQYRSVGDRTRQPVVSPKPAEIMTSRAEEPFITRKKASPILTQREHSLGNEVSGRNYPYAKVLMSRPSLPILRPTRAEPLAAADAPVKNATQKTETTSTQPKPSFVNRRDKLGSPNPDVVRCEFPYKDFNPMSAYTPQPSKPIRTACEKCLKEKFKCSRVLPHMPPCQFCTENGFSCDFVVMEPVPTSNNVVLPSVEDWEKDHSNLNPRGNSFDELPKIASFLPTQGPVPARKTRRSLACTICRVRMIKCRRVSPTGSCTTCEESGVLCEFSPAAAPLVQAAKARGCDTCRMRMKKCRGYSPYKDCQECDNNNVACHDRIRDIILEPSEERRAELMKEAGEFDQEFEVEVGREIKLGVFESR